MSKARGSAATSAASAAALAAAQGGAAAASGAPPVEEQAEAVAAAVEATGHSTASGAAAEDVRGSAREAPGIGSGAAGANVPGDLMAEGGRSFAGFGLDDTRPTEAERREFMDFIRPLVREEVGRALADFDASEMSTGRVKVGAATAVEDDYDLEITSRVEGFRRGGIAHPAAATPPRRTRRANGRREHRAGGQLL